MTRNEYNASRSEHTVTRSCHMHFLCLATLLTASAPFVRAETLSLEHEAKINFDFGKMHVARWSGGALVDFTSNRTAAPTLLSFDSQGNQLKPIVLTIPAAEMIDLDDIAHSPDGWLTVCGKAFDHSGRGSGFISIINPVGDQMTTLRLYPYYPTGITFAADGTIWTLGLEAVDGKESGPGVDPEKGVIRHFDRTGKQLGWFIPRSSISSPIVVQNGFLASANGRVGWYTGPVAGPGSEYYEILSDGTVRKYPLVALSKSEFVTGLALLDNGRTYITTSDSVNHVWRLLSISGPVEQWTHVPVPDQLTRAFLYGGDGGRLVFHRPRAMTFMHVAP